MSSFSVIIPTHDDEAVVLRTLRSVEDAIACARGAGDAIAAYRPEVIVVDDGSCDATPRLVADYTRDKQDLFRVLTRPASSSAGTARNVGVGASTGELLFFLDGDDRFHPDHIRQCLRAVADPAVDYVKTGVELSDSVHPDWQGRIENSLVINLCVRRRCHDRIGGFADFHLFRRHGDGFVHECDVFRGIEDVYYNRLLHRQFRGLRLPAATVTYHRYPGNSYDRLYARLQVPPDPGQPELDDDRAFRVAMAELIMAHGLR